MADLFFGWKSRRKITAEFAELPQRARRSLGGLFGEREDMQGAVIVRTWGAAVLRPYTENPRENPHPERRPFATHGRRMRHRNRARRIDGPGGVVGGPPQKAVPKKERGFLVSGEERMIL